jgi:hypothetical protein
LPDPVNTSWKATNRQNINPKRPKAYNNNNNIISKPGINTIKPLKLTENITTEF